MIKTLKKFTAATLVLSLVCSNVTNVYANKQAYIKEMTVTDSSPTAQTSTNYRIKFGWSEPVSAEIDTTPDVVDADATKQHSISEMYAASNSSAGYDIYFRNGTKSEAYASNNQITQNINYKTEMSVDVNRDNLNDSSIYSFTAIPWHLHTYERKTTGANGIVTTTQTTKRAPFESNGKNYEALYLTDIVLEAKANGKEIEFSWKNPTYMGKTIFTGFNIYYYPSNGATAKEFIQILPGDTKLALNGGVYTYTTTLESVNYGNFYNATIEPLVNNNGKLAELRSLSTPMVTIDGVEYPVGFSSRQYLYENLYLTPSITLDDISSDNLQISWDKGNYSKVEIYKSSYPGTEASIDGYTHVGTVGGINSDLTAFILQKPTAITYYKVVFYFDDGTRSMVSDWVMYDPSYKAFEPYLPKIYEFYGQEETSTPKLNVTFNAFQRLPINEEEQTNLGLEDGVKFVDPNVEYTIWITDDADNFNDSSFDKNYVAKVKGSDPFLNPGTYTVPADSNDSEAGTDVQVYQPSYSVYYTYANGAYVKKPTKDGKIYYIKILATRPGGDISKIATDLTYVKPLVDNTSNPITLTNPPLRLELDSSNVPVNTNTSFNIEWQEAWNEAYDYDTEQWYAVIGVDKNGNVVYGKSATDALADSTRVINLYQQPNYSGNITVDTNSVLTKLKRLGAKPEEYANFVMRKSSLADAKYEIFVTPYSLMEANGGYEVYYNKFLKDEDTWRGIDPTFKDGMYKYTVDEQDDPTGELEPGTSYVVYIRPYVVDSDGNKSYSYNPGYVVGETLSEREPIDVIPPTIILYAVDETESTITFEFEYSKTFTYDFKYSNKLADYTEGGEDITNEELLANGKRYVNKAGDTMLQYTIYKLAPDTMYYTWGRATYGENTSLWSLPLEQETDPLTAPQPPKAIGLMDKTNIQLINQTNDTSYVNPSENYFIIDFARVPNDLNEHENIIEENGDGAYIFDEMVPMFPGAYFDELVPNQKYYIRAKTVLTAVIDGINAEYYYSYIVQISESSRFEDVMQVHVFDGEFEPDGVTTIQVESGWSNAVVAKSGKTDKEYDGDKDDILYPIPDSDFEIIVGKDDVVFEYRGSGEDSSGNDNNLTDQRLISNLVESGAYSLVADLSGYDDYAKSIREVKLPYRLVSALNSSKISFTFKAEDTYVTTTFQDIDKIATANNINDFGNDSMVSIKLADKTNTYSSSLNTGSFISPAQKIIMTLETPTRSVRVQNTYDTMEIAFKINDRLEYETSNVYVTSFDDYGNQKTVAHAYDDEVGTINIYTKMLTTYGPVKQGIANIGSEPDYYYSVVSQLNITDLRPYKGSNPVYALQYNNIIAGILKDKAEITMGATLSNDEYTALGRSGMLVSGDKIKREDAIASMVAVYEQQTGSQISTTTSQSSVPGISSVSSKNKTAVNKAYDIGLYDDSKTTFSDTLTFDELFYMVDLVLADGE